MFTFRVGSPCRRSPGSLTGAPSRLTVLVLRSPGAMSGAEHDLPDRERYGPSAPAASAIDNAPIAILNHTPTGNAATGISTLPRHGPPEMSVRQTPRNDPSGCGV